MKILLVTDHFPPEESGASGRTASLHRYLPQFGIETGVITLNFYGSTNNEKGITRYDSFLGWKKDPFSARFFSKIRAKIVSCFGLNIDTYWLKNVLKDISRIKEKNYQAVYASYPSITALLAAKKLAELLKIPLISEFRDGLCYEPIENYSHWRTKAYQNTEKQIVASSQAIITIGNALSAYFEHHYPDRKIFTVRNGFDPVDFLEIEQTTVKPVNKFRIAHFGNITLSRKRSMEILFKALGELKQENKIRSENFMLDFIGSYSKKELLLAQKYSLSDCLNFRDKLPRSAGLAHIKKDFDGLLFYGVAGSKTVISAKLPEYLALNMPIIGICRGNEAASIIEETHSGLVADFTVESIKDCFLQFIDRKVEIKPDYQQIKSFNRRNQTERIAEIIREVVKNDK